MNLPKTEWDTELPLPKRSLVEDAEGRRGRLMDGLIERDRGSGKVVRRIAFVRPLGGGCEWQVPFSELRPVGESPHPVPASGRGGGG